MVAHNGGGQMAMGIVLEIGQCAAVGVIHFVDPLLRASSRTAPPCVCVCVCWRLLKKHLPPPQCPLTVYICCSKCGASEKQEPLKRDANIKVATFAIPRIKRRE